MNQLYPLSFKPIFKETIWGGKKLKTVLQKNINSDHIGESWELSGVKNNLSVVKDGFLKDNNLEEIIEIYMGDLVGDKVYEQFGLEFPLLIKFIDANDDLSIQVHPDDELAAVRHDSFGKTEMWYVMQNEPGARLISGFNKKVNKQTYLEFFKNGKLKELLNYEKVSAGDVFFIPAGRIHAIGKGTLLAEIQQTSDVTYRIYDWDRKDAAGRSRELHTEQAVDAIDYDFYKDYKTKYTFFKNKTANIIDNKYFFTNILHFNQPIEKDYILIDSFIIYICMEGSFEIQHAEGKTKVSMGETILLPAVMKSVILYPENECKLLEVYIK
jgi:mannose-6-phosphate isomerase